MQDIDYAELMLIFKPALHQKLLCKKKNEPVDFSVPHSCLALGKGNTKCPFECYLQLKPVFASHSVRYLLVCGMDLEGLAITRIFQFSSPSVLAQFVHSNLKSFCVSLPFLSAASVAVSVPEFPITIIPDQVIKADMIPSPQERFSSRCDEYLLYCNSLDSSHA